MKEKLVTRTVTECRVRAAKVYYENGQLMSEEQPELLVKGNKVTDDTIIRALQNAYGKAQYVILGETIEKVTYGMLESEFMAQAEMLEEK